MFVVCCRSWKARHAGRPGDSRPQLRHNLRGSFCQPNDAAILPRVPCRSDLGEHGLALSLSLISQGTPRELADLAEGV